MNVKKHPELAKSDIIKHLPKACGDEKAAVEFFERQRWGNSPVCPHCQNANVYKMTGRAGGRNKRYLWRCRACGEQYTVRTGAIYEDSKLPLRHWAYGFWRVCASKKGVSAREIERNCQITHKSALFLMHRIRFALTEDQANRQKLGNTTGICEVDETFVGGKVDDSAFIQTMPPEIVANMPQRPFIKHGMAMASYSPVSDVVNMPDHARFESEHNYHATLFHELVHATGHEKRLKRASIMERNGYGSDPYGKEELIAEMGSAFLCGYAGIVDRTINSSAAYLEGWLKQLKEDKTLIVHAAAQAQKAADFILGHQPENQPDNIIPKITAPSKRAEVVA